MVLKSLKVPAFLELQKSIYKIRFLAKPPAGLKKVGEEFRLYPCPDNTFYVTSTSIRVLHDLDAKFEIIEEIKPEKANVTVSFPLESVLHDLPPEEVRDEIAALSLSRRARGRSENPVYCGRTREELPGTFVLDIPGGARNYHWRWIKGVKKKGQPSFADRFPKLLKRMTDPDTRFVVSLGGGGLRMFAHPSIFKLIEALGAQNSIEEVWGCSGGSIAGMAYVLGADHRIIEQEGYDLYHKKYDLRLSPSAPQVIKNLILNKVMPGITLSLKGFVDIQRSLQDSLARVARYRKPSTRFFSLAYNLSTKRNEVLTPSKINSKLYNGQIRNSSPINVVLASTAIPVLFAPRVIKRGKNHHTYIDGSLFEEVPLNSVYQKWRIDKKNNLTKKKKLFILAVNLFPYLSTWKIFGKFWVKYLPVLELITIFCRLADLSRRSRIDDQVRAINADPHAEVVEVNLPKLSRFNFLDPQIIPTVIDKARGTFFDQFLKIEASLK